MMDITTQVFPNEPDEIVIQRVTSKGAYWFLKGVTFRFLREKLTSGNDAGKWTAYISFYDQYPIRKAIAPDITTLGKVLVEILIKETRDFVDGEAVVDNIGMRSATYKNGQWSVQQ